MQVVGLSEGGKRWVGEDVRSGGFELEWLDGSENGVLNEKDGG